MDNKISNIKERSLYIAKNKGITVEKFCKEIDMSYSSFKSSAKNTPLNSNAIANILSTFPDISSEWLILGEGDMLKSDNNNVNTHADERPVATPVTRITKENKLIPLVHEKVVAGFGGKDFSIAEQDVKEYYVIPKFKHYTIDFMIEVHGSSMYPKYNSGDVIACTVIRNSQFIQWNKCHVIATVEQGILVKRLKPCNDDETSLLAISDNKEYPPFKIPKSEITGIALVAGVIRLE